MRLHFLVWLTALLLLAGCQTAPAPTSTPSKDSATLTQWEASGRFAYKNIHDGGNASIHWRQNHDHGQLHLSGPMGFGSAELQWHPALATLTTNKGTITAPNAETLAAELTGIMLPVDALMYWLRGLPWPHAGAHVVRHGQQLSTLKQLGWHIEYDRWQQVDGYWLPHRLKAKHNKDSFTVVVQQWVLAL